MNEMKQTDVRCEPDWIQRSLSPLGTQTIEVGMAALLGWLSRAGQTQPVLRSGGPHAAPQPGGCAHRCGRSSEPPLQL